MNKFKQVSDLYAKAKEIISTITKEDFVNYVNQELFSKLDNYYGL